MKNGVPVVYLPPDPDKPPNETKPSERRRTGRPKAIFQWPPDCLWPFIDTGWSIDS